ncbi:MAG: hypothetical protein IKW08_01925 [Roseburia sp.]|nr:hypothetical protein [Roseburia sp.]
MKQEKITIFLREYILPSMIGILFFFMVYGMTPLDVTNDAWIMAGYDESDLTQHYAGWVLFRSADWSFPLGMIESMADGTGTMLTFTDSIPIAAIFFKAIDFLLPETFQYFGWYILICFLLQAIAGYKIVQRKVDKPEWCYVGVLLFLLSPILLERSFRHTALGSHWFVLFALLIYLKSRDARKAGKELFSVGYVILNVLTVLIHPYFLPMVMIFTALTAWENMLQFKSWIKNGVYLLINVVLAYGAGWLVGALGWDIESARFGYGYFSMNLNAIINPLSLGGYEWSKFLPQLPQIHGNYDGFNYLGVGVLLLALVTIILGVKKWFVCADKKQWLKDNIYLILALVFLTVFSVTNVVTWNDKELLNIPIPDWLYWKAGIFRASGRIFYPVYYVIFTYIIYQLAQMQRVKVGLTILIVGVLLQFVDLSAVLKEKHVMMDENSRFVSLLDDEVLTEAARGRAKVTLSAVSDIVEMRRIAVWAGKNGMKTSYTVANSGIYPKADALMGEEIAALESGNYDESIIYATQDLDVFTKWMNALEEDSFTKYYYNDYYYLIPNLE